jgi:flavodoxin
MDSYDIIFIGHPIWFRTIPMALYTFFESYNFTGKTIIPFHTHGGGRIETSVDDLKKLCPQSTFREGLRVQGSNNNSNEVNAWLRRLGFNR